MSIASYNLEMYDAATSAWVEVVGETNPWTSLSFTKTALTVGTDYRFRIRSENVHGFGAYSDEAVIRADDKPSKMNAVSTAVNGLNVVVTWAYPPTDNGSAVTAYKVSLLASDGITYTEDAVNCDGSLGSIVSATACSIPITSLEASPYLLAQGDTVVAVVEAYNVNGWGDPSDPNPSGALI